MIYDSKGQSTMKQLHVALMKGKLKDIWLSVIKHLPDKYELLIW